MSKCKTCGKEIKWLMLKTKKWHPVDPGRIPFEPSEKGKLNLVTMDGDVVRGDFDLGGSQYGYTSHFATCPQADLHRR